MRWLPEDKSFFNPDMPLWLPKGTVRALLVLGAMLALLMPVFKFVAYHEEIPLTVKDVLLVLLGGLIAIVRDYFSLRRDDGKENGFKQDSL